MAAAFLDVPPPPRSDFEVAPSEAMVRSFHAHGFAHVERITTDEELDWMAALYDRFFAAREGGVPGGYFDLVRPYDAEDEDLLPQVLFPEQRFPQLRETAYVRNGRRIAAALLGVAEADLRSWGHMIVKRALRGPETPWHQDEAYWDAGASYVAVGCWLPLDGASVESGCLHFVPGSHLQEVLPHRHLNDDPRVHGLRADIAPPTNGVPVPLPRGGASFHHPRTLHYAGPNRTGRDRRAYANEFQLRPVALEGVTERPWVLEGREAWAKRTPRPG